jgi:hypothetical protein
MTDIAYNFKGKTYLTTLDESKRSAARAAAEYAADWAAVDAAAWAAVDADEADGQTAARTDFNARVELAFQEMTQ